MVSSLETPFIFQAVPANRGCQTEGGSNLSDYPALRQWRRLKRKYGVRNSTQQLPQQALQKFLQTFSVQQVKVVGEKGIRIPDGEMVSHGSEEMTLAWSTGLVSDVRPQIQDSCLYPVSHLLSHAPASSPPLPPDHQLRRRTTLSKE